MNATDDVQLMPIRNVCVFCASSSKAPAEYMEAARALGEILAGEGWGVVYGAGGAGLMGRLADGALSAGGRVYGVIPGFMVEMEWGRQDLSEVEVVDSMHRRKARMLERSDAVVALPGGCGTLEELLEAITWKRLGLFSGPILLVNIGGFYDPLIEQLGRAVKQRLMNDRHRDIWRAVTHPREVPEALRTFPPWPADARHFAAM